MEDLIANLVGSVKEVVEFGDWEARKSTSSETEENGKYNNE
jgi:hypothetical protein